jgi:hypothetical protein
MKKPSSSPIALLVLTISLLQLAGCGQEPAGEQQANAAEQGGRAAAPAAPPSGTRPGQTPAGRAQGGRAGAGRAQGAAASASADETELVFERELFRYPAFQRRNPFQPLVGNAAGPRFEQMELRGVIYSNDSRQSVALLGLRGRVQERLRQNVQRQRQQQEAGTALPQMDTIFVPEPSVRVKVGQTWGNVRVVQIERDHVVLDVTDFGQTERRTLAMMILRPGGPS